MEGDDPVDQIQSGEVVLDVRDLPPPEPMEKALAAIGELQEGCWLRMVHRREPRMLYPLVEAAGFSHTTLKMVDVNGEPFFSIFLWKTIDSAAAARVAVFVAETVAAELPPGSVRVNPLC